MGVSTSTELLATHTPPLFDAAVRRAAALLRHGEVVALPTETVYGLAANALDAAAVRRIFKVKGRPSHNPIIVHVAGLEMARSCVTEWPATATHLVQAFWPGPLTLVLPRAPGIPDVVTAGGSTVGVRWPNHPLMQAVIRECGFPLAAPSANPSNTLSPTSARHVLQALGGKVPLIVDGGPSQIGIESTVLDLTTAPPRILRPGMIHAESLVAVVGAVEDLPTGGGLARPEEVRRSPGLLRRHYSPKARLAVLGWSDDADLRRQLREQLATPARTHIIAHTRIPAGAGLGRVGVLPHDAAPFARALYAELHRCDEEGAELIVVEAVPATVEWRGIADRLRRAAA